MTHDCIDEETLLAFVQGRLVGDVRGQVEAEIESCPDCTERMLSELDRMDRATVVHDVLEVDVSASALLPRGGILGRYVVQELVATGRAGPCYRAIDRREDRDVALKLLDADTDPVIPADLEALVGLVHPNLVRVLGMEILDGRVAVCMEWVSGQAVTNWVRGVEPTWTAIRDVFVQAAKGLHAVHRAGLVHGRVAATDVIVTADGNARIQPRGFEPKVGGSGAPERSRPGHDGARADQYEFCMALYEALYGESVFDSDHEGVRPPPSDTPVPSWMFGVVKRGLATDPEARFPSLDALAGALSGPVAAGALRLRWVAAAVAIAGLLAWILGRS